MASESQVQVLLVEDSAEDAELTLRALRKRDLANGVRHVSDGAAALDFLFARGEFSARDVHDRPRLVLLDLKLPKVGGLEVLRALRADPRTRTIPVVVMTSSKEDRDLAEAYELGVNSYVVKPLNFEEFAQVVGSLGMYWLRVNEVPTQAG